MEHSLPLCLTLGAVISMIVSALKTIPLVKAYPKVTAVILSAVSGALVTFIGDTPSAWWLALALCTVEQFAASVATHEVVTEPAAKLV